MVNFTFLFTRGMCLILLAITMSSALAQNTQTRALRIASDDWCPYVCGHNGKLDEGFFVDALRLALAPSAYKVEMVLMPYRRAMDDVKKGNVAGIVAPAEEEKLLMSRPLGYAHPCFYTRNNSQWTYTGIGSLTNQTLGVIQYYNYDNGELFAYIRKNGDNRNLIDEARGDFGGISNIRKLMAGRVSVIVEDEAVMPVLLAGIDTPTQVRLAGCLAYFEPLTIGLNRDDPQSAGFIDALNAGIDKLESSGGLSELRQRYKLSSPPVKDKKR